MSHAPVVGLKMVMEKRDGKLVSIYDDRLEYIKGASYEQRVMHNHGGGMYLYATDNLDHFVHALNQGVLFNNHPAPYTSYAIIKCSGFGPFLAYDNDGYMLPNTQLKNTKKFACSSLRFDSIVYRLTGGYR